LEYLLDRAAAGHNLNSDEGRIGFITEMVPVAGRIPDDVTRERFADRLAQRTRIAVDVIRTEIRRNRGEKRMGTALRELPSLGQVTKAEKGLIWLLVHEPAPALAALGTLDDADLEGLAAGRVLDLARKLNEDRGFSPTTLLERLTMAEANLVTAVASERERHVLDADGCARILRRRRYERERAAIQTEIDRLQELGARQYGHEIDALWARKRDLLQRIESLM
jgi:DNA primase